MGLLMRATCKSCGRSWQYGTGSGFKCWKLEEALTFFSKEAQSEIKLWAHGKELPLFSFEYGMAVCNTCRSIVNVPVLTLLPENVQYVANCGKCGVQVSLSEDGNVDNCPECGVGQVEIKSEGLWD